MIHFTKEQLQKARSTNLYDFLLKNHPSDFSVEGQSIRPIHNHSLSIKKGYCGYNDFATDEKGNSVDFLVKYMGYSIDKAVLALCDDKYNNSNDLYPVRLQKQDLITSTNIIFPEPKQGRYRNLFSFLLKRSIPAELIKKLINTGLLYQSNEHNNCVFINHERDWAELRGTYTYGEKAFHGIIPNSRQDGCWYFYSQHTNETAFVCESAIDAISLYLLHLKIKAKIPACYISIGGVSKQITINRIQKSFKNTVIAVDNDNAGQQCRNRNFSFPCIIPYYKDWNEDLQNFGQLDQKLRNRYIPKNKSE